MDLPEPWVLIAEATPGTTYLVKHKDACGDVYDVAHFVGKQPDGEMRWIMSDIRLESRQLTICAPLSAIVPA